MGSMVDIRAFATGAVRFFRTEVWKMPPPDASRLRSCLLKPLRALLVAVYKFRKDRCPLRASALTFYSLLSVVPVAAMVFGIAKGFGFQKLLEKELLEEFPAQREVVLQIIEFAHSLLENTKGGMIAGVGVVLLFWSAIKVLDNIETSFNDIWDVRESRSMGRKFSDYLSIMLTCPVLVIMSSSLTVFITTQVTNITQKVALLGMVSPLIFLALKLIPYCLIWVLFSFVYILLPNTKVNLTSGILAGVLAGTIYQIAQWGYILFQVNVSKHNAIYGSFAALPLFLVWLQLSWLIVLFGAQISYAFQHADSHLFGPARPAISFHKKKLLCLLITHLVVKRFARGEKPFTAREISHDIKVPLSVVEDLLCELVASEVLSLIQRKNGGSAAYQPALDIGRITVQHVVRALEKRGVEDLPVEPSAPLERLAGTLNTLEEGMVRSHENRLLRDL